jgi:hypothetical protein
MTPVVVVVIVMVPAGLNLAVILALCLLPAVDRIAMDLAVNMITVITVTMVMTLMQLFAWHLVVATKHNPIFFKINHSYFEKFALKDDCRINKIHIKWHLLEAQNLSLK